MKNNASNFSLQKSSIQYSDRARTRKHSFIVFLRSIFILLFAYSGAVKFASFAVFQIQLHRQPFPDAISNILVWALPISEILVALLIALPQTWKKGLQAAFGLIVAFTIYTGLAASGAFGYVPCACGGFIQGFLWWQHLLFNTVLATILVVGLLILNREYKNENEQKT